MACWWSRTPNLTCWLNPSSCGDLVNILIWIAGKLQNSPEGLRKPWPALTHPWLAVPAVLLSASSPFHSITKLHVTFLNSLAFLMANWSPSVIVLCHRSLLSISKLLINMVFSNGPLWEHRLATLPLLTGDYQLTLPSE